MCVCVGGVNTYSCSSVGNPTSPPLQGDQPANRLYPSLHENHQAHNPQRWPNVPRTAPTNQDVRAPLIHPVRPADAGRSEVSTFNITKYLMLCTGSGRKFCMSPPPIHACVLILNCGLLCVLGCPCMLLYLGFGALGVTAIFLTFYFDDPAPPDPDPGLPTPPSNTVTALILCTLSGVAYILCCCFWCCTMIVTQACRTRSRTASNYCRNANLDPQTNYVLVSCCFWMVAVLFVAVTGGLLVDVFDRHQIKYCNLSLDFNSVQDTNFVVDIFCLEYMLVWSMVGLVLTCMLCNVLCYRKFRKVVGNVFGKIC